MGLPFLLLYRLTTNQNFSFDALTNAIACESNEPIRWFHPNHPLYPSLGVFWYRLECLFGYRGYAIYSLARFNTILMSAALGILWFSLSRDMGKGRALASVFFLGMTFGLWHYAVDGRAVGASVFCSVLVIVFLLKLRRLTTLPTKDIIALGFFSSLLSLMHGIAFLHVFPIFIWLLRKQKNWLHGIVYLITVAFILTITYVGIFYFVVKPLGPAHFFSWALGYAGFNGADHALQSGFWLQNISNLAAGLLTGWVNVFMVSPLFSGGPFFATVVGIFILFGFLVAFFQVSHRPSYDRELIFLLIGWGGLVGFFLAFWSPGQEGFRLHVILPWTVAAALCLPKSNILKWFGGVGGAILFCVNFTYAMYPNSFIENNVEYRTLLEIQMRLKPGDLILAGQSGAVPGLEVLRPYFFPEILGGTITGRLRAFRETNLETLYQRLILKSAQSAKVYFSDDLFDHKSQTEIEQSWGLKPGEVAAFAGKFERREFFSLSNGTQIYHVIPQTD